jgi:hypothetical protein
MKPIFAFCVSDVILIDTGKEFHQLKKANFYGLSQLHPFKNIMDFGNILMLPVSGF